MDGVDETQEDGAGWEALNEFAQRRDELDPFLLRGLLANTLRSRGFAGIVWSDDGVESEASRSRIPAIVTLIVIWSFGFSGTSALGLPWFVVPIGIFAVAVAFAVLAQLARGAAGVGALLLLAWIIVGLVEAVEGALLTLIVAYLLPLGLALLYGLANRLLRLRDAQDVAMALAGVIKSAPLIAPVVLIVLFLPVLSSDVWRIAGELTSGSLLVVGALSVGLLFVVVRLQLGSELGPMIAERAEHLSDLRTVGAA